MEILLVLSAALLLDIWWGEPTRFHPLVGFGKLANTVDTHLNSKAVSPHSQIAVGALSWAVLVLPLPVLVFFLQSQWLPGSLSVALDVLILYLAIGFNSLKQHAMQVYQPIKAQDLSTARHYCGYMVSRDTAQLSPREMSRAVTESVLENGHDAVFASLFWYLVGGAPMVILHRLSNTLDAMWGYRTARYLYIGRVSARIDDVLGYPSAKITAILYALQGHTLQCLKNAFHQSQHYKSLNGGWAMASGATALKIRLGGVANYFGKTSTSPQLGEGEPVTADDIPRALSLVARGIWLFLLLTAALLWFAGERH